MANLTTRSLTTSTVSTDNLNKGSALTISEMDSNFLNLNTDKLETSGTQTFSGDLTITSETSSAVGSLIFKEAADNGTDAITLKAPTSTAAYTITLPATAPTNGYGLTTDGSGNLSWTESAGDITEVIAGAGMTGGSTSGSATLNVIAGNGITVNADDIEIDTTVTADLSTAQTLTNKSIDADNNTITNLEVDNLKTGVLDTDITTVSASDDTLASAKAIKTYVDAEVPDDTDGLSEGSTNLYYTDTRFDTRLATKDTDDVSEGSTNLYYTNARVDTRIGLASIDDLSDVDTTGVANGKILKYNSTTSKFEIADDADTEDNLANNDTDDLAEGSTNLYYTDSRFDTRLATKTTDNLTEGSTNLYFTNARVDSRIQTLSINEFNDVDTTGVANGKILKYNSTTSNFEIADDSDDLSNNDTDDLAEGSTNLYYTDARAQAVSINNLSEDTTPELGGTLDILGNDIKSSTANVVISADATDKDIILKAKDAGGTLNTHSTFFNNPRVIHDPVGMGGTDVTVYDQVIDTGSIRIGSTTEQFSNDGNAPNADNNYAFTGIIVTNGTKQTWPQIALTSYGGANPLYNRFGNSAHIEYPNSLINFKAARGTEGSETAIQSGDNIGSFQFNAHDGNDFGGSSQRSSASIEVKANENHSSSNDRAAKITFNVMPTGGDGSKASRDTVIEAEGDGVKIGNLAVGTNKYLDVDVANSQLVLNTTNKITTGTDEDLTLEPNGTGDIKLQKDVLIQGGATDGRYLVVDNFDGATPITFGYDSPGITIASKGTGGNRDFPGMILHNSSSNGGAYPSVWIQRNKNDDPGTTGYLADDERIFAFYGAADRASSYYNQVCGIEYRSSEAHSASAQGGKIEFYTMPNGTNSYNGQTKKMTIDENIEADVPFVLKSYTTTERNSLTAVAGMMIFNTTDSKAQVYDGTSWANLH